MMALLPPEGVEAEQEKLRRLIKNFENLEKNPPQNEVEEVCRPIAMEAITTAIHEQIAYMRKWNVIIDDETLHRWGK